MKRQKTLDDKAAEYFTCGYNCSQSVLLTLYESWCDKNELIPKVATAFGSGIGSCGSICGAVTGGVMALGTRYGTNEPQAEKRKKAYDIALVFLREFEAQHRSILCRELIGYDLSVPEELEKAQNLKVFDKKCTVFLKDTVDTPTRLTSSKR